MRNTLRPLLLCLISCLCLVSSQAADLKTFREVYQKNSDGITQAYQPKFAGVQQQYQKALDALKAQAKSQGDLAKTMSAIAESERFQKAKSLPAAPDESAPPEIKALQSAYVKQYDRLEQEMTAELGTLTTKYDQALDRLQKELVKAEKLPEALEVQQERAKAQTALKGFKDQFTALTGTTATNVTVTAAALLPSVKPAAKSGLYLVVDLSAGTKADKYPVTYLADVPKGGWGDEYKTDKLVLRKIEPGTFVMGSPEGELGHKGDETQHEVTVTKAFYIGVFEVTRKQWERVMGDWPSNFNNPKSRETRPVEKVSYNDLRGAGEGANWPATNSVDAASFMGRLRARTGQAIDLPTEAQWEYACRAGTATALNSGKNLTAEKNCPNLSEVGRYLANSGDGVSNGDTRVGMAKVGSYRPNEWGLYDLHGNVWEWCLDWRGKYVGTESDPKGAAEGSFRVIRGGSWRDTAVDCTAAHRNSYRLSESGYNIGFRVVITLP
jgi:formylglycine-generating enzyme required for sulfatase activity